VRSPLGVSLSGSWLTTRSPINTYSGNGTTKRGARPQEHGVAYSVGHSPMLVPGEPPDIMPAIAVIMADPQEPLHPTSRIYLGLHQAIQYNVKVKEVGLVAESHLDTLMQNWKAVDAGRSVSLDTPLIAPSPENFEVNYNHNEEEGNRREHGSDSHCDRSLTMEKNEEEEAISTICTTQAREQLEESIRRHKLELVTNPKGFFKKGRVFMTLWTEPKGFSAGTFIELARFVVIKSTSAFSICLRINTYSGQATTKHGVAADAHAAIIPVGGAFVPHPRGEHLTKDLVAIKVENPSVTIDPMSRVNFTKPYSVEHNIMVRNIGRVNGESVGLLEKYLAESLGYTKP
jgi:hypothetical protein